MKHDIHGFALLLGLLLGLSVFCVVRLVSADELTVQCNLSGGLNTVDNKELVLTFSDDMVALGGKREANEVVQITPAVPGAFHWRGTKTLAFKPDPRFRYSTRYRVVVPAGVGALNGKVTRRAFPWEFITPLAYPTGAKKSGYGYFTSLRQQENLPYHLELNDSLFLEFAQPISVTTLQSFLTVTDTSTARAVPVTLQAGGERIAEIRFPEKLRRETTYTLVIRPGFFGSEGQAGTTHEFKLSFATILHFRLENHPDVLTAGDSRLTLSFTNPLKQAAADAVAVVLRHGGKRLPLKVTTTRAGGDAVSVDLPDDPPLRSGDTLEFTVRADGVGNAYGESLAKAEQRSIPVCSHPRPNVEFAFGADALTLRWNSLREGEVRIMSLRDEAVDRLVDGNFGLLQRDDFQKRFVEGDISHLWRSEEEGAQEKTMPYKELPLGENGFLAVLTQRALPFNACHDVRLHHFPLWNPFELEVFHLRGLDFILKGGGGSMTAFVYDNRNGAPLPEAEVLLRRDGKETPLGRTDAAGMFHGAVPASGPNHLVVRRPQSKDQAFLYLGKEPLPGVQEHNRVSLFSDRGFYLPGETVHLAGVAKVLRAGRLSTRPGSQVEVVVRDPEYKEVLRGTVACDEFGGFAQDFTPAADAKKGRYTIQARFNTAYDQQTVTIDHFQANTFEVNLSAPPPACSRRDSFTTIVTAAFLAGTAMAGEKAVTRLDTTAVDFPANLAADGQWRDYRFGLDGHFQQNDKEITTTGRLDAAGRLAIAVPLTRLAKTNHLAQLQFSATAVSAEGKEVTARTAATFWPGKRAVGVRLPWWHNRRQPLKAELVLLDREGRTVSGEATLTLYRRMYENGNERIEQIGEPRDLFIPGKLEYVITPNESGPHLLKADVRDENGDVISTSAEVWVWDSSYASSTDRLELQMSKNEFRCGETMTAYLSAPRAGKALVTVEGHTVLDSFVIDIDRTTPITLPIAAKHFPSCRLSVTAVFPDGSTMETSEQLTILGDERKLRVEIQAAEVAAPASPQQVRIQVRGNDGRGRRAKLFVYAVDEGNLALSAQKTPDPYQEIHYTSNSYYNQPDIATLFSRDHRHWRFSRPLMDITLDKDGIFGAVLLPDGTPAAGATVTLRRVDDGKTFTATTSPQGYYFVRDCPAGIYAVRAASAAGKSLEIKRNYGRESRLAVDLLLLPPDILRLVEKKVGQVGAWDLDNMAEEQGVHFTLAAPAPAALREKGEAFGYTAKKAMAPGQDDNAVDFSGIRLRSDFRPVLFFRQVSTDDTGRAVVDFTTADLLTAYRIMVVAYDEECLGSAEKRLTVSQELMLQEAMPDFAHAGDRFAAGVQLSSRGTSTQKVDLLLKPQGLTVSDEPQRRFSLAAGANRLEKFHFLANKTGNAELQFLARSATASDGLLKRLTVFDNLVRESLLDFDVGADLTKTVQPPPVTARTDLRLTVTPSILQAAGRIAEKLIFYPYECLEQRTSKVLPYLAMDEEFIARLEIPLDRAQIRRSVEEYLKVIPEFRTPDGGLAYYRGAPYSSPYLTLCVLWAMELARERDYAVDAALETALGRAIDEAKLDAGCRIFRQYLLARKNKADADTLHRFYEERAKLDIAGRAFLFRALGRLTGETERLKTMAREFTNSLQIEADFAYFDAGELSYDRDRPFYSSRYATALVLQALLEVQGGFDTAPRVLRWLLEADPWQWHTTQTNFWILYAMNEYARRMEAQTATRVTVRVQDQTTERSFSGPRDRVLLEREITGRTDQLTVAATADRPVYLTSELRYQLVEPGALNRGIGVVRNVYDETGKPASAFRCGRVYQVELLLDVDKEVPYAVVEEPLAAGFEVLREDTATGRDLAEFNREQAKTRSTPWARRESSVEKLVWYTYALAGKVRLVYFVKALYDGEFTWLPTLVQGMYHPQYQGRGATRRITVSAE